MSQIVMLRSYLLLLLLLPLYSPAPFLLRGFTGHSLPTLKPPTENPARTVYCIDGLFDAAFTHPYKDLIFLFKGDRYYRVVKKVPGSGPSFPVLEDDTTHQLLISIGFPGLSGPYDAAVTDARAGVTYFFHNHMVTSWDWMVGRVGIYNEEPVELTIFAGLPPPITAVAGYRNYFIFFTGEEQYFIYNTRTNKLNPEPYVSLLSDETDMPPDAAFRSFFNGVMFTLYGDSYTVVKSRKLVAGAKTYDEAYDAIAEGWEAMDVEEDFGFTGKISFCGRDK